MPPCLSRVPVVLAALVFVLTGCSALSSGSSDRIDEYTVDAQVNEDGTVDVVESITYDFGEDPSPGLLWEAPTTMRKSFLLHRVTERADIEVSSPTGAPDRIESLRESRGWLYLEIGDEEDPVTGEHVYEVSYTMHGALVEEGGRVELPWQPVTGNWGAPVNNVGVTVAAPAIEEVSCHHYDRDREEDRDCGGEWDGTSAVLEVPELDRGSGMETSFHLAEGSVTVPEPDTVFRPFPRWLTLAGVVGLALSLVTAYYIVRLRSRVQAQRRAREDFPEDLPDLPPALAGFLHRKGRLQPEHVMALLMQLEQKGQVTVQPGKASDNWVFVRQQQGGGTRLFAGWDMPKDLTPSEQALMRALFHTTDRSDLKQLRRGLSTAKVSRLRRMLNREGRRYGLRRPLWFSGPHAALWFSLLVLAVNAPGAVDRLLPVQLSGLEMVAIAVVPVTAVFAVIPSIHTRYGEHVQRLLDRWARRLGSNADPALALALGASPGQVGRLSGPASDLSAVYTDRSFRERWNRVVARRIRLARRSRSRGGGSRSGGGRSVGGSRGGRR